MFKAIKSFIVGDSSNQNKINSMRENKPLKSDISNNNIESINNNKKKTVIKGEKNDFDFSEEYEDDPKQNSTSQSSSSSENKEIKEIKDNEIIHNPIQDINDIDFWRMAHCVYVKNSLININMLNYVPFIKLKKRSEGLLSYIGFGTEGIHEIKYLAGFDEHFMYMINLMKDENKNDKDAMKTIGNHYDIIQITNIEVVPDTNNKNRIIITILFVLDNDVDNYVSKIKKFYFERPNALKFLKLLKLYLNMYKVKVNFTNKVFKDFDFNEDKEQKEKEEKEEKKEKKEDIEKEEIKEKDKEKDNDINKNEEEKDTEIKNEEEEKIKEEKKENKENEEEGFSSENVEEINNKKKKI